MMLSKLLSIHEKKGVYFPKLMLRVVFCESMSPLCNKSPCWISNLSVKGGLNHFDLESVLAP